MQQRRTGPAASGGRKRAIAYAVKWPSAAATHAVTLSAGWAHAVPRSSSIRGSSGAIAPLSFRLEVTGDQVDEAAADQAARIAHAAARGGVFVQAPHGSPRRGRSAGVPMC